MRARGPFLTHPSDGLLSLWLVTQEACYIATWPWGYSRRDERGDVDMTPRCVGAVAPYENFLQQSGPGPLP